MDKCFKTEMPKHITQHSYDTVKKIGFHLGYGKITLNGFYCNNNIMIDQSANIIGRCRKVHLPGHAKFDSSGSSSILINATSFLEIWSLKQGEP